MTEPVAEETVRVRARVRGVVQGVGFRPAIRRAATNLGLAGLVGNDEVGVFLEVQGPEPVVRTFLEDLGVHAPPMAAIDEIEQELVPTIDGDVPPVHIVASRRAGATSETASTVLSPDLGPCERCLEEVADHASRRHRYPFTTCTDCGPRFTITTSLPYDRARTTMAAFAMCERCAAEYDDPDDRRFHAQTNCCPDCGPTLVLRDATSGAGPIDDRRGPAALDATIDLLRAGAIVAVKGVGGFHLAVDATDEAAVARLRQRKHRPDKPFAVLVGDVAAAETHCHVRADDVQLLASSERPVVVLPVRRDSGIAPSVAPGLTTLGVLLPPSPLHHLLVVGVDRPLVLTSGNRGGEPIVIDDEEADARLHGIADHICTHDRPISHRADDSVVRPAIVAPVLVRRARGHVPRAIDAPAGAHRPVLACGALLKATVSVARDGRIIASSHIGDLTDHETVVAHSAAVDDLCARFGVRPEVVAHDLHPDFASTASAQQRAEALGAELLGVQHHHAHVASCLVDNGHRGPAIGVAFDGLGLGTDGTIWGGEILAVEGARCTRLGHLAAVPMPGGDAATHQPWRMAAVHAAAALDEDQVRTLGVFRRHADRWSAISSMATSGVHAPLTSSVGRLFDAVAAMLDVRDVITYEGQAAVELEQLSVDDISADDATPGYDVVVRAAGPFAIDPAPVIRAIARDVAAGVDRASVAARFHATMVTMVTEACRRARTDTGLATVALSGGVFQNVRLLDGCHRELTAAGFDVLVHRRVPPNDGGISVGQAAVAVARDQSSSSSSTV